MHPAGIRKQLADLIRNESAYEVPTLCEAVGLESGDVAEAMQSKFRYALKRLKLIEVPDLIHIAKHLNDHIDSAELRDLIRTISSSVPSDITHSEAFSSLTSDHVQTRWSAALERRDSDPEGAITLARTLLEDVCKLIISSKGHKLTEQDDLPSLYRKTAPLLKLAPDQHTEQIFKQILGSCQTVVHGLGAVRNKLSDAHGSGPSKARPTKRHAKLAVNLAGTMASFLIETHLEQSALE